MAILNVQVNVGNFADRSENFRHLVEICRFRLSAFFVKLSESLNRCFIYFVILDNFEHCNWNFDTSWLLEVNRNYQSGVFL